MYNISTWIKKLGNRMRKKPRITIILLHIVLYLRKLMLTHGVTVRDNYFKFTVHNKLGDFLSI